MIPEGGLKGKGCLLFLKYDEVIDLAKTMKLSDFEILIVSTNIVGSIKRQRRNKIYFDSKFDNVEFVPSLVPSPGLMEFVYADDTKSSERFIEGYDGQLSDDDTFKDLTCIVDMVVNDNIPTIIMTTNMEFSVNKMDYLMKYILNHFELQSYTFDDMLDPGVDITDKGDEATIKELIVEYKAQLSGDSKSADDFYNYLTESMMDKYKSILMKKSEDALREIATSKGIYVRRKATKEEMVKTILDRYR